MKKFILKSLAGLVFIAGCEETKLVDEVFEDTRSGAVLRTLSQELALNLLDETSTLSITVEQQDESFGADFEAMDVFVSFTDNNFITVVDANGDPTGEFEDRVTVEEASLGSVSASEFATGDRGLPTFTYSESLSTLLEALGLTNGEPFGGDVITIRFVARLTDGSEWSVAQANNNITGGAYFRSPFQYGATLVCELETAPEGDWVLDFTDSFGDGWNGASLTVVVGSTETELTVSDAQATAAQHTVTVPANTETLDFVFATGAFDEEIGIVITAPSGNVVFETTGGAGLAAGSLALNLCNE